MANYYPPAGFHFKVEFNEFKSEVMFQSVSGLNVELETEELAEGGENRFKHRLPVRTKFSNLVLNRGLLTDSKITDWVTDAVLHFDIQLTDLTIKLLDENHEPLVTWNVVNAYPVKWALSDLNAEESKLMIETLELSYNYFNKI